jgi:uncharacterized membrane protein YfcA
VISALRGGSVGQLLRRFWYLPLAIALGAWLGTHLLLAAPPEPFTLVLALVLIFYLNLDRLGRGRSAVVQRLHAPFGVAFGLLAGIFEAIANVAGPMLFMYFMLLGAAPREIVQTLNLCFSIGKGSQVATLAGAGALGATAWATVAGLSLPAVAALAAGMRVRERIDADTYRAWLRKALWVMAVVLIAQFSASVFASNEGDTPLHAAVEKGQLGEVRSLLAARADPNARAKRGETPLHLAALHVEPEYTDLLLAAGADPRARNADGESVLFWAALSGHIVVVQRLLARGADANAADRHGNTPLHAAAHAGHLEIARLLLPRSAKPAAKNRAGQSALDYAREQQHPAIVQLLKRADQ